MEQMDLVLLLSTPFLVALSILLLVVLVVIVVLCIPEVNVNLLCLSRWGKRKG